MTAHSQYPQTNPKNTPSLHYTNNHEQNLHKRANDMHLTNDASPKLHNSSQQTENNLKSLPVHLDTSPQEL
jgi:hypothetical protein